MMPGPMPWPTSFEPTDRIDFHRLRVAIAQAVAELEPRERVALLDRIGPEPWLSTDALMHPDEGAVGVIVDGEEVLTLDLNLLAGVDRQRLDPYLNLILDGLPPDLLAEVQADPDGLQISYPDDPDGWVEFTFHGDLLGRVHRTRVAFRFGPPS